MNAGEIKFREVFGPFLESWGYKLKYGAYMKIEPEHLLIKQVFIRTIAHQWEVCARLATFYHDVSFKKAEWCGAHFVSLIDVEEDKAIRSWLIQQPGQCYDNYCEWKGVSKDIADAYLKDSVIKHIDCQFKLFRNKVFTLLEQPKSLYEACDSNKKLMELTAGETREWYDEISFARIYFYLGRNQEALEAVNHYFERWECIFKERLTPRPNDARYNRYLEAHKEEIKHSRDAEREIYQRIREQIENNDDSENRILFKANVWQNAREALLCRLISPSDYDAIIQNVIGDDIDEMQQYNNNGS